MECKIRMQAPSPPHNSLKDYLFVPSDQPQRLVLMLFCALLLGGFIGELIHVPDARPSGIVLLASSLGSLFIWFLTFFVHPLVASSVWNAVAQNSKAAGIAITGVIIFICTTAMGLFLATLLALPILDNMGLELVSAEANTALAKTNFEWICAKIARPFTSPWASIDLITLIAYMAAKAFIFVPLFPKVTKRLNAMFEIMQDLSVSFMLLVLRGLIPGVFFMALGLVGTHGADFLAGNVARILAADLVAMFTHMIVLFMVISLLTGRRATEYVRTMLPTYIVAFGSSTSMGTLPTALRYAEKARIDQRIANFIFPFGATVNMDGTCIGIFVRTVVGLEVLGFDVTYANVFAVCGTVMAASIATAAAPGASIVLLRSVIVSSGAALSFDIPPEVVATTLIPFFATFDFVSDRFRTLTNIWGDTMAALLLNRFFVEIDWMKYLLCRSIYHSVSGIWNQTIGPLVAKLPGNQGEQEGLDNYKIKP